jgi:hypothetical protein
MALSSSVLSALKKLEPDILNSSFFSFFEFMKYDTDDLRNERIILKKDLVERFKNSERQKNVKPSKTLMSDFLEFAKVLDSLRLAEDEGNTLEAIKWAKITEICNILRKIESSDEKKVRWSLLYLLAKSGKEIPVKDVKELLKNFKISNIDRALHKIIKAEINSGLTVTFDSEKISLESEEKLAEHYVADAIEEKSRRSPGEIEQDVLELLDEGSYSNQEISRILEIDEAIVSRVMTKLRNQNKLVLSSFGAKGFRFYTTNCQNCPFGKSVSSCRKDAISYIVSAFKEAYGIELTSQDFEDIESNQALLGIKRITKMSKKFTMTTLESNMYENYETLLQRVVSNSIGISQTKDKKSKEISVTPNLSKLPKIFQMGLKAGIQYELQLMKKQTTKPKTASQSQEVLSQLIKDSNKILQSLDM